MAEHQEQVTNVVESSCQIINGTSFYINIIHAKHPNMLQASNHLYCPQQQVSSQHSTRQIFQNKLSPSNQWQLALPLNIRYEIKLSCDNRRWVSMTNMNALQNIPKNAVSNTTEKSKPRVRFSYWLFVTSLNPGIVRRLFNCPITAPASWFA